MKNQFLNVALIGIVSALLFTIAAQVFADIPRSPEFWEQRGAGQRDRQKQAQEREQKFMSESVPDLEKQSNLLGEQLSQLEKSLLKQPETRKLREQISRLAASMSVAHKSNPLSNRGNQIRWSALEVQRALLEARLARLTEVQRLLEMPAEHWRWTVQLEESKKELSLLEGRLRQLEEPEVQRKQLEAQLLQLENRIKQLGEPVERQLQEQLNSLKDRLRQRETVPAVPAAGRQNQEEPSKADRPFVLGAVDFTVFGFVAWACFYLRRMTKDSKNPLPTDDHV